ncbi:MAG: insulinase family protein [Bacteroidia bacterium]|nr:insulinase family protein [Bacteroidia bacterium]NND25245.1 insulinase family protein [Flavobacteriaceae bacterium]NNK61404.1 insulinase family protein [Flavobacteriaceae bacterium]RZW54558.1 MAG: insulinase family protein [Flavobacteriaceae bacterium]
MKTKVFTLILLIVITFGAHAQLDRSKQPKPGPAPKIMLGTPDEFELKNGLKVMIVENHKLPRVSFNLTIDNPPVLEGDKAGVSTILGAMLGNGTTTITKDEFNEEIDFLGANLNFGSNGAFASSLSKYAERIMELMADATKNPLFSEEEFQKEVERQIENLKTQEKDVTAVSQRIATALTYGTNHPFGEFISEASLKNINLDNVRAFYEENFNPRSAYLVVVGDVDPVKIRTLAEKYFGEWSNSVKVDRTIPNPKPNVQFTQINFVDMPNAVQSNISVTNTVNFQMNDPDYHAVLMANQILGGSFGSYLNMNLREKHGYTYGARSSINTNKYSAARFRAGASVRNMVTDSSIVETLKEINRIRTEPVSAEDLANAKAKYVGNFVLALENPQTIARYALNIKLNNLPEDFYTTYLKKINAVTIEDVKRVANKYFKPQNSRIIVVGKGSEVLENLEKTGIPIKYFDTYANPVSKPEFTKPIPEGVTAQSVLDNYIKTIGGKNKLMTIKTLHSNANVTIEGVPLALSAELKLMVPNKESMEMTAEGMGVLMKQKFNGEAGYMEQQGMKTPFTSEEISEKQSDKVLFPELYYDQGNVALEAMTTIDGKDVFKLKVNNGDKKSFRYYDASSKLLVRVETETEVQGQTITSVVDYDNYSPVNGVQVPYNQRVKSGPQVISMNFTNVKVNEGVTDADFN